jgi:hypothetical protein
LTFDATPTHVLKYGSSKFTDAAATDSSIHTLAGRGQASASAAAVAQYERRLSVGTEEKY